MLITKIKRNARKKVKEENKKEGDKREIFNI